MSSVRVLLGQRLRELRMIRGLSQGQLADACDISRNEISDYERGVVWPRPEKIDAMLSGLGASGEHLFPARSSAEDRVPPPLEVRVAVGLIEHGLRVRPDLTRKAIKALKILLSK